MSGQKVLGELVLHYGGEYLNEAIKSIEPYVDKIVILYSSKPSYGFGTSAQCPETEEELKNIAFTASNKIEWHNVIAHHEGMHRGLIYRIAEEGNYDGILVCDADEVMGDLTDILPLCFASKKRHIGFGKYINFWKSFNYACYDGFTPIRYINLHNSDAIGCDVVPAVVYHFSCAQRMPIMEYKLLIHGHKAELRPNWLRDVYQAWTPTNGIADLHLVAFGCWPQAQPFDKTTMPEILLKHINYNKEVIY